MKTRQKLLSGKAFTTCVIAALAVMTCAALVGCSGANPAPAPQPKASSSAAEVSSKDTTADTSNSNAKDSGSATANESSSAAAASSANTASSAADSSAAQTAPGANDLASQAAITADEALNVALSNANTTADAITLIKNQLEYDAGVLVYDVEFVVDGLQYEYEVNATDGRVMDFDVEYF